MAIRVSAIVSAYNSERFIRGALEDLTAQTLFARGELEIIVIDSGSQEGEAAIVRELEGPQVRYVRTERETIYGAWNRGVELATGDYLTNANTDDRHRADALEVLAQTLDERGVGVVYGDSAITSVPNQPYERNDHSRYFRWPEFSLRQLLVQSIFGPQPMWRRSLHEEVGYFDDSLTLAGDHEFFLRAAWKRGAFHVNELLGLYYDGGAESQNLRRAKEETGRVLARYRRRIPLTDIYPEVRVYREPREARAVASWDFAHCIAAGPHKDLRLARELATEALATLARGPKRSVARALRGRLLMMMRPERLGRRRWGLGRDSGDWHPVLAGLPPIANQIVFTAE